MIFRNSLLNIDGVTYRVLETEPEKNVAWVISMQACAMPTSVSLSDISGLPAIEPEGKVLAARRTTEAERRRRDKAVKVLTPLLVHGTALFDDARRYQLIKQHAKVAEVSVPSLYKWLRMYWQYGQCDEALTPNYKNCGITLVQLTAGRGAKARFGVVTYQLNAEDIKHFEHAIQTEYLNDKRKTIAAAYQRLIERHYSYLDGNGRRCIREAGNLPSARQFSYYLKKSYPTEVRLRMRLGDKTFEQKHRAVLGTVEQDCLGVGHIYECDATVADVFLVAEDDINTIVGKPIIYIIIDRWSRLIVGFYVGFENASWVVAMQALLSISEDKEALCRRYGVEYRREDWPAHCVFPTTFLVDMGEVHGRNGQKLSESMYTRVAVTPGQRPDWKPVVETGNKQTRVTLQDGTPGFDPPENARERQAIHYDKDACLTLYQFTRQLLELILKHNRAARRTYDYSMQEAREQFLPTPINVWNKGIAERSGTLTRYSYEHVRFQLLPRDTATVSMHGVAFKGCLYTSNELVRRGWFVKARAKEVFKTTVAFDHRLADNIYVIDDTGEAILCELTPASQKHRGRSFAEVKTYDVLVEELGIDIEHNRRQTTSDYHAAVDGIHHDGRNRLNAQPRKTRSARKADTKPAREKELKAERRSTGSLKTAPKSSPMSAPMSAPTSALVKPRSTAVVASAPSTSTPIASTPTVVDFRTAKRARGTPAESFDEAPLGVNFQQALPDKDEMARRALERLRERGSAK